MKLEEIKEVRLKLGMTQEQFAHFIGVTGATVNRWENNKSRPSKVAINYIKEVIKKQGISK